MDFVNANTDLVNMGDVGTATNNISVCAWINVTSTISGGQNAAVSKMYALVEPFWIFELGYRFNAGAEVDKGYITIGGTSGGYNDEGNTWRTTSTPLSLGRWYHLCGTWATGEIPNIYLNGVLDNGSAGNPAANGPLETFATNVNIGFNEILNVYSDMKIAYVHVFSRTLSANEVTQEMRWPESVGRSSYYYIPLREKSSASQISDMSGAGNHGTNDGADESSDSPPVTFPGGPL